MKKSKIQQVREVSKKYWYVPGLLILMVLLFLAGSQYGKEIADHKTADGRRILHYVDPMNPAHTSPEPGLAPCGMEMEPVYADEGQDAGALLEPGSVKITPAKQQIIGVRVATVEKSPWTYTLRTFGKVAADETRTYRLNAFSDGFITRVFDNTTGSLVRRDEPLATFFSKDLFTELQTYYYAVYAIENLPEGQPLPASQKNYLEAQKEAAEFNLMDLGMSRQQIKDLIRSKAITQEIVLSAPVTSFVLTRNVTEGQKFTNGEELYLLADLSRVWILADLFGDEANYVQPGEEVRVTLADRGETHLATVSEVLPEFDPATLTTEVRLELNNPQFTFRPGMFVDVEVPITVPPTVNIPVDAIMDSGLKQTVFVDLGNGYFEPRSVKTGWRLGNRVEIVQGLEPGERIVISGNFLIDSESRMKLAAAGFFSNVVKDPVCGMNVDESKARTAGLESEYQQKSYYFCSDICQKQFNKTPDRYLSKPEESSVPEKMEAPAEAQVAPQKVKDVVCGHELDKTHVKTGTTSTYEGKTYYFCSHHCKKQFDSEPELYLHKEVHENNGSHAHGVSQMTIDPVCGLPVAINAAKQAGRTSEHEGKVYYFDTDGCKQRFDKDPEYYLASGSEDKLIHTFQEVPTNPDLLLRLRRDSIRAIPAGKGLAPVEPHSGQSRVESAAPNMQHMQHMQAPAQPSAPSPRLEQQTPPSHHEPPQAEPSAHHSPDGEGHQHD